MDKKKIAKTAGIVLAASAITGLAFTAPSMAATAKHSSVASQSFQGKGGHGDQGFGKGKGDNRGSRPAPISQDVTVTVPDDGATYELVVTETAPPAAANNTNTNAKPKGFENHSFVVPVTGTGSVTVSVPGLHPGAYKVDLVKVASSQDLTVAAPAVTPTPTPTPATTK